MTDEGPIRAANLDGSPTEKQLPARHAPDERRPMPAAVLSRAEAAERLGGISARSLRRMELSGDLAPVPRAGRSRVYLASDVDRVARTRPMRVDREGMIAARAFAVFDRGGSARGVVVELGLAPVRAEELRDAWARLGGAVVLSLEDVTKIEAVIGRGGATASRMVEVVTEITKSARAWKERAEAMQAQLAALTDRGQDSSQ